MCIRDRHTRVLAGRSGEGAAPKSMAARSRGGAPFSASRACRAAEGRGREQRDQTAFWGRLYGFCGCVQSVPHLLEGA
eukprot:2200485-Rhodomonas_salina.1